MSIHTVGTVIVMLLILTIAIGTELKTLLYERRAGASADDEIVPTTLRD